MRDLIPWSLVYGAQNAKHAREVDAIQDTVQGLRAELRGLALIQLKYMFECSLHAWNDGDGHAWKTWDVIRSRLRVQDVDDAKTEFVGRICTLHGQAFPIFGIEMTMRADELKRRLAA